MHSMDIKKINIKGNKKTKRMSPHVESATICIDNIMSLEEREMFLLFQILYNSDDNNIVRDEYGDFIYNLDDLSYILGLRPQNIILRNLNKKGAIKKIKFDRRYVYAVNPYVVYRGKTVSPSVYMEFNDSNFRYIYGEDYFEEVLV